MGDVFKAISDETWRATLDELHERDEQKLLEICSRLTMKHNPASSRQGISQHLDVLEEAGLVHSERRGRYKFHTIDTRPLAQSAERWPIGVRPMENPREATT